MGDFIANNFREQRLLTPKQAARYLGYKSTSVLKRFPIEPIRLAGAGLGSGTRYDVAKIDQLLNDRSGITEGQLSPTDSDDAQSAFDAWERLHGFRIV